MSDSGQEQNRQEEATPFKLQKAREKGAVARGIDLGYFASLAGFACFVAAAGTTMAERLAAMMHRVLAGGIAHVDDPRSAVDLVQSTYWPVVVPVLLFGGTMMLAVGLLEIIQLRGILFSAHPLKPDFSRINPAKGLKRLFSMRMLKESFKSVVKLTVYVLITWLIVRAALSDASPGISDAASLTNAVRGAAMKLLWAFVLTAFCIAALDQVLTRKEFAKQMRMSRRDVTREHQEREGDPRLKAKRKKLHVELMKQAKGLGALPGSDMVVVNPAHYAVALGYDRIRHSAPIVRAKGRDLHALAMKTRARQLGLPIFENAMLARALYAETEQGAEITGEQYRPVAELYFRLGNAGARQ